VSATTITPNTAIAAAQAIRRGHRDGPGHDDGDACEALAARLEATAVDGDADRDLSPLDMARNLVRSVGAIARYVETGGPDAEIQAHVRGLGPRQHEAAKLAANLALVSIAEDLHRALDVMLGNVEGHVREDAEP
jgi:hypothetical protein